MKIRRVVSLREFDALAPAWYDVTREGGQTSPFLSHDWFSCCWRAAAADRACEVWFFEDTAGPLAFVPFLRFRARYRRLPVRVLRVMDAPDTPFVDLPVGRGLDEVIAALYRALREQSDWDLLVLPKLPAQSGTAKALTAALTPDFPWRAAETLYAPYVALDGTWEEFLRRRSQRFRKTCRSLENRIQRERAVVVEEHDRVDPDGAVFADVLAVSSQSWKGPRGLAMATMQQMPQFFYELTRRASANGWLRLWILRIDGRPVATEYQICDGARVHALRADFDATLADLSPGAYLNLTIIRSLFARSRAGEYNMGPGDNEYKLRWTTGRQELLTIEAFAPTAYGRFLHRLETRWVPMVRRLRSRGGSSCA